MIKSYLASALVLFVAVFLEAAILSNITALPAVPDILLLCSLYVALLNGKTSGEINGFVSGVFVDFLSGSPFGFNCLYRTIIGYFAGVLGGVYSFDGFFMPAFCAFCATLAKMLCALAIAFLFPNLAPVKIALVPFLFELACNAILAPLVFKFLGLFKNLLALRKDAQGGAA